MREMRWGRENLTDWAVCGEFGPWPNREKKNLSNFQSFYSLQIHLNSRKI
jgi:hypothetical protein